MQEGRKEGRKAKTGYNTTMKTSNTTSYFTVSREHQALPPSPPFFSKSDWNNISWGAPNRDFCFRNNKQSLTFFPPSHFSASNCRVGQQEGPASVVRTRIDLPLLGNGSSPKTEVHLVPQWSANQSAHHRRHGKCGGFFSCTDQDSKRILWIWTNHSNVTKLKHFFPETWLCAEPFSCTICLGSVLLRQTLFIFQNTCRNPDKKNKKR